MLEILQASSCDYSSIVIMETGNDDGVLNSEFNDTLKYSVFRCDGDYLNSGMIRGGCVCLALDSSPNPIDLNI